MRSSRNERWGGSRRSVRRRHAAGLIAASALGALALLLPTAAGATVLYPPRAGSAVRTASGFELTGTVYDYGGTTTWHFEYGTTTEYGTSVPVPDGETTSVFAPVSEQITGLQLDTTYHWRLVSTNTAEGTAATADQTFSTSTTSTTSPTGGGGSGETGSGLYPGSGGSGSSSTPAPTIGGSGPKRVAKSLRHGGRTLLVAKNGRTLYSLSVEGKGKFVCTAASGCTGLWHPLTVAAGVTPKGPVKLGTIRRPEGTLQVTYRGHPLYTFGGDKKAGQVNGEGLKDVGTWHAAVLPGPKP